MAEFFDQTMKRPMLGYIPSWIHPNHLTIARALLAVPVILLKDKPALAVSLLILSSVLDILDGPLARIRNQRSQFGAWLDSMADKAFVLTVLFLACWDTVPLAISLPIAGFELVLIIIRIIKERYEVKADSNAFGAIKTWSQSVGLAFVLTQNDFLSRLSPAAFIFALIAASLSLAYHIRDFRRPA